MDSGKNTVSATNQVSKDRLTEIFNNNGKIRVLFIGNSITRHEPLSAIGWENDWGMAATKLENDYLHIVLRWLENKYGKVDYCITNCGNWEKNYYNDEIITNWEMARNFCADIVIVRIGENVALDENHPFTPHYLKMIEYFASNPNAKIIVTGLFWKNNALQEAIKQGVKEKNYLFADLYDLSEDNDNMAIGQFWHQGVAMHPSDNGMRKIAERIIALL